MPGINTNVDTPVWHTVLTTPANGEAGNQAAFSDFAKQVADNLAFLALAKAEFVFCRSAYLTGVTYTEGASPNPGTLFLDTVVWPNFTTTADRKVCVFARVQGFDLGGGDDTVFFRVKLDDGSSPPFYSDLALPPAPCTNGTAISLGSIYLDADPLHASESAAR
jgi:hypothetical protein